MALKPPPPRPLPKKCLEAKKQKLKKKGKYTIHDFLRRAGFEPASPADFLLGKQTFTTLASGGYDVWELLVIRLTG
jgi:hypothetical protein